MAILLFELIIVFLANSSAFRFLSVSKFNTGVEFFGPVIEAVGYGLFLYLIIFGQINTPFAILFMAIAILWGTLLSVSAVLMEDLYFDWYQNLVDKIKLLLVALAENFGYRQLTVVFRIIGLIEYVTGKKSWGKMTRKGFQERLDVE